MKEINNKQYWEYFLDFVSPEFDSGVFDCIIKMNYFKSFENGVFTVVSSSKTVQKLMNEQFKFKLETFMSVDSGQQVVINAVLSEENYDFSKVGGVFEPKNTNKPLRIVESSVNKSVFESMVDKFLEGMKPETMFFEDFIVGGSNQIAFKASVDFSTSEKNNILFLYGDSGVGKTHLISSVANRHIKDGKKVIYITAAQFVEAYTSSLGHISSSQNTFGSVDEFVRVLNSVDLLVIDDVQYFAGKTGSVDTFFNVFEYLSKQGKKIAVASDMPPSSLNGIPERLKTRFSIGGVIKLSKPETELAKKYLEKELKIEFSDNPEMVVTPDVYDSLVYNFGDDFRSLKGVVRKLGLSVTINNTNIINMDFITKNILDDPITKGKIRGSSIQKVVCEKFMVEKSQLIGKSRKKEVKDARHAAIYLYRKKLDYSYKEIGMVFGGRDHSTIMHSEKSVVKKMGEDRSYKSFIGEIEKEIFG